MTENIDGAKAKATEFTKDTETKSNDLRRLEQFKILKCNFKFEVCNFKLLKAVFDFIENFECVFYFHVREFA